jgi:polar amino acid transport system permease protein
VSTFWHFLFYGPIVDGAKLAIILAVICQLLGIVLGLFLALARLSRAKLPWLRWASGVYIWFFRGTPLLVQLIFVYDGIPQVTGEAIVLGSITSAIIALSLNEGAYMAEITRAGILSVDPGQVEAAKALGMTNSLTMRRIVIPQAVRFIIPPTANEFISMLKNTSLALVIATPELLFNVSQVYDANLQYFPLLTVAAVWYLAMTTVATYFQGKLEQRAEYRRIPRRGGVFGFTIPGTKRA